MRQPAFKTIRALLLALFCFSPAIPSTATTAIALRSRYRVVLAADSRAIYGINRDATECKLFEIRDVYATVSGLAHYGTSYRATDAVRDGFSRPGDFQSHVSATAYFVQQRVGHLLASLQRNNPNEYRSLMQRSGLQSDFVAIAVAESVNGQPMLGIVELQRNTGPNTLVAKVAVCPGNCRQGDGLFYLGYWEQIRAYVANSGQPRSVGSAASIDRLIRLEINAHPAEVAAPINILELGSSGPRWLQNGGNCSLPGVGW
jgi:hypothetical protein